MSLRDIHPGGRIGSGIDYGNRQKEVKKNGFAGRMHHLSFSHGHAADWSPGLAARRDSVAKSSRSYLPQNGQERRSIRAWLRTETAMRWNPAAGQAWILQKRTGPGFGLRESLGSDFVEMIVPYFKHHADAHRGRSMQSLFDVLKHAGPLSYYTLVEMCTEKLWERAKIENKDVRDVECIFQFHLRIFRQNFQLSLQKTKIFLEVSEKLELFNFEIRENSVTIFMPKLLEILSRDMKRARRTRADGAQNPAPDTDPDSDPDKEKNKKENADENPEQLGLIEYAINDLIGGEIFTPAQCEEFRQRVKAGESPVDAAKAIQDRDNAAEEVSQNEKPADFAIDQTQKFNQGGFVQ